MNREDKLRRRHIQRHTAGVGGFCPHCGVALQQPARWVGMVCGGCGERVAFLDVEEINFIRVKKDNQSYETGASGWVRRSVSGTDYYTKTVAPGVTILLHHLEAAGAGVEIERRDVDPTMRLPSVQTTSWVQSVPRRIVEDRMAERREVKAKPRDVLKETAPASVLSREAKRLSDRTGKKETNSKSTKGSKR